MVLANVPLVEHIVNRVSANLPASHSRDDLVQTGILGLISATARFDPEAGAAFSTFAGRRIEGAIIDLLRSNDWAPRSIRRAERQLSAAEEKLGTDHTPTLDELTTELGCSPAELQRLRNDIAKARLDSLDRTVRSDDSAIPLAATVADNARRTEDQVADDELLGYLRNGVALLPERHRTVIVGFFFEGRTATELGALLGVTQSRASQIKEEAIRMLRAGLTEAYRESDPLGLEPETAASLTERQRVYAKAVAESTPWPASVGQPGQKPPSPPGPEAATIPLQGRAPSPVENGRPPPTQRGRAGPATVANAPPYAASG
ncbi:MAG: sigma-70 family RNA polymerase sigma factor [Actinomycetota bacterium]